jgi:hypothetical protein
MSGEQNGKADRSPSKSSYAPGFLESLVFLHFFWVILFTYAYSRYGNGDCFPDWHRH